jgi:pimeloyl-ACP methyl ester carboxylesterase
MPRALLIACVMTLAIAVAAYVWLWTPDKSRAELEAKYFGPQSAYVEAAGVRLHVRDSGPRTAPALILLHGFGSSLHTWEPWAARLSQTYRVVRYDLTGAGLTGADPTGDYSDARGMQILAALMDKLGIARATLIGHSMGGKLAWKFAAANPQRIEKLVLVSPDGYASPGFDYDKTPEVPAMVKLMRYALPKSMLRSSLAPAYGDPKRLTEANVTRYHDLMLAPGVRDGLIARMEQVVLVRPEPLLKSITAPVLLIWGQKDGMIPFTNAADYTRTLPNSTLVSFPGLGHVPHEEAPDETIGAVLEFLAK